MIEMGRHANYDVYYTTTQRRRRGAVHAPKPASDQSVYDVESRRCPLGLGAVACGMATRTPHKHRERVAQAVPRRRPRRKWLLRWRAARTRSRGAPCQSRRPCRPTGTELEAAHAACLLPSAKTIMKEDTEPPADVWLDQRVRRAPHDHIERAPTGACPRATRLRRSKKSKIPTTTKRALQSK